MPDILDRLDTLTRQGEDYIWRPARDAVAEIERLRSVNAALVEAVERLIAASGHMSPFGGKASVKGVRLAGKYMEALDKASAALKLAKETKP